MTGRRTTRFTTKVNTRQVYKGAAALAALLGGLAVSNMAAANGGAWYLSPSLGIIGADSSRGQVDNGTFGTFGAGRTISDTVSVEARLFILSLNSDVDSEKTNQRGVTFDALWFPFGTNQAGKTFAPFLLAGVGAVSTEIGDDFDSSNSLINLGAGASIQLTDSGFALRGEARYRFDFVNVDSVSSFNDWQAGLGLNIPLATDPFDNSNSPATPTVSSEPEPDQPKPPATKAAPPVADIPATDFDVPYEDTPYEPENQPEFEPESEPNQQTRSMNERAKTENSPWTSRVGAPDGDDDGVPDMDDRCANTPADVYVDSRGCAVGGTRQRRTSYSAEPQVSTGAAGSATLASISDAAESEQIARELEKFEPASRKRSSRADSDGDGIADSRDSCPNSPRGVQIDGTGCEPLSTTVLDGVTFISGSDEISSSSKSALARVASLLRERPSTQVEIAGHTDWNGSAANNLALSQLRAEAVRDALVAMGVGEQQLKARGYGDSKPIANNSSSAGRAKNRRVEMRVIKN